MASRIKAGDPIPSVELLEGSPDKKVNIAQELASGKGVIINVPAAYSPNCNARHIPEWINSKHIKDAGKVFVVSVNDAFVMQAWKESLDPSNKSGIRFLADAGGELSKQMGLQFEAPAVFADPRAVRSAIVTENGKVKGANIEPDNTGITVSSAESVLGK